LRRPFPGSIGTADNWSTPGGRPTRCGRFSLASSGPWG